MPELNEESISPVLPGIDTPVGGEQRLRIHVPSPETLMTLGSSAKSDMDEYPIGPAGFALKTVEHLAAEIHKSTLFTTKEHTTFITGKTFNALAGEQVNLASKGTTQVGSTGAISITAASPGNFPDEAWKDPEFTVDPQQEMPKPPKVDAKTPRESTEQWKTAFKTVWAVYKVKKSTKKIKKTLTSRKLATGLGKDTKAAKFEGATAKVWDLYVAYSNAVSAWSTVLKLLPEEILETPAKPSVPKVTIYGDSGIALTTPSVLSGYGQMGVSFASPLVATMKAGSYAAVESFRAASVFGMMSASVLSLIKATVTAPITTVEGEKFLTVKSGDALLVSAKGEADFVSDASIVMSAKKTAYLQGSEVQIGADVDMGIGADNDLTLLAKKNLLAEADKRVRLRAAKGADIDMKADKLKIGVKSFLGEYSSSSFKVGNIETKKSECTIKGTVRLG